MTSRYSSPLLSPFASFLMFLGQRLETLGKAIVCEMERPYAGAAGDILRAERKGLKSGSRWLPDKAPGVYKP